MLIGDGDGIREPPSGHLSGGCAAPEKQTLALMPVVGWLQHLPVMEGEIDGWHFLSLRLFPHGQESAAQAAAPCRIVAATAVVPGMGHE